MHNTRKKHGITRAAAILLAAGLCFCVFSGCGEKDDGTGKVVNFPIEEAPQRLDPVVARSAVEMLVLGNCMEGLVRQGADGALSPGAAQRWEASPGGGALTFYLREDNHWALPEASKEFLGEAAYAAFDTRVTAEDFVFGLRRALPEGMLEAKARDRFVLEITFETAQTAFLQALARCAAMPCRRAFFEACGGRYGLEPKYLLCNGPFTLVRMDEVLTRLERNENYRAGENALPRRVNLWTEPDAFLRARLLGTEYDAAVVPGDMEAQAPEGALAAQLKNATLALVFQCGRAPLDDTNLRAALCAALEPGALGYENLPGLLPGGERVPQGIGYDLARAEALAESAGGKIRLTLICAPAHETLLRRALQAWQKVLRLGLEAKLEPLEPEEFQERLEAGDFDVAVVRLRMEQPSALEALRALVGEGSPARYSSPVLEELLRAAARTADPAGACLQAEEHLLQNGVYYPLETGTGCFLTAPLVEGLEVSAAGDRVWFWKARKWEE